MKNFFVFLISVFTFSLAEAISEVTPSNLVAVHITNILPQDNLMIPGLGGTKAHHPLTGEVLLEGKENLKLQATLPWRRMTLHWSLGGPVEGFDPTDRRVDYTDRSYAILEPLQHLLPESLGGMIDDWHTFGPHRLSKDTVILVPESEKSKVHGGKVVTYDPSKTTLHAAMKNYFDAQHLPWIERDFATAPYLCLASYNYVALLDKIAALDDKAPKSTAIRDVYAKIQKEGLENVKAFYQKASQEKSHSYEDPERVLTQNLLIKGEQTNVADVMRDICKGYPKITFGFTNLFCVTRLKEQLGLVFNHMINFRSIERSPATEKNRKTAWYASLMAEDQSDLVKDENDLAELNNLLDNVMDEVPVACQKTGELWIKGLKIWVGYVAKHRLKLLKEGNPFYGQSAEKIGTHLNNVLATVEKHSTKPLMALYREDLAKKHGFDFLAQKYPDLKEEADKPYHSPTYDMLKGKSDQGQSLQRVVDELGTKASQPVDPSLFSENSSQFLGSLDKVTLEKLIQKHPQHGFFKVYFEREKEDIQCFEDILLSAEYMYQRIADQQHKKPVVLFVGRSGYLHLLTYQEVLKQMEDTTQRVEHVVFSGAPDSEKRNKNNQLSKKVRPEYFVTSEKLAYYFSYLDQKKLGEASDIYLVDMVSSGSGLNSFLRILNAYFEERQVEKPSLHCASLSNTIFLDVADDQSQLFHCQKLAPYGENKWSINYFGNPEMNTKPFKIDTFLVYNKTRSFINLIDNDTYHQLFAKGVYYPPQCWCPAWDEARETGGPLRKDFEAYVSRNAAKQIAWHMKKFGIVKVSS